MPWRDKIKNIKVYFRKDNELAGYWADKIKNRIRSKNPEVGFDSDAPDAVIILGGDGTILEGAKKYHHKSNPLILGFNLGNVGFLASVREPNKFLLVLDKFLKNNFMIVERMLLSVSLERRGRKVFSSEALNEVVIQNTLGMVDIEVRVDGTVIKNTRGTGIMAATATGSTAYNLSAHGPIVMHDIKCIILTELMTHDVPSPSIVFKHDQVIKFKIESFRERNLISVNKNRADVLLITDGGEPIALREGDIIKIESSPHLMRFVEFEKNYFFKSLKEKFSIN